MKTPYKTKKISLQNAMKSNKPLTNEDVKRIQRRMDTFFKKLRKDFGGDRFDIYTAIIISVVSPSGILTSLRGNIHTAQFAIANAVNDLVENVCDNLKLTRESVLLYCITDIAEEVRNLWKSQHSPSTNAPTKVPVEQVE